MDFTINNQSHESDLFSKYLASGASRYHGHYNKSLAITGIEALAKHYAVIIG